jgi:hypothetical protein
VGEMGTGDVWSENQTGRDYLKDTGIKKVI